MIIDNKITRVSIIKWNPVGFPIPINSHKISTIRETLRVTVTEKVIAMAVFVGEFSWEK